MQTNNREDKSMKKNRQITIGVDLKVYPLEAVYVTSYVFLDKAYIFLDSENKNKIRVSLKPKSDSLRKSPDVIKREFMDELLNNTLRYSISNRNSKIREYIVKEALFFSQPQKGIDALITKEEDWKEDPLEIAIPWEEKYSKSKKKRK